MSDFVKGPALKLAELSSSAGLAVHIWMILLVDAIKIL